MTTLQEKKRGLLEGQENGKGVKLCYSCTPPDDYRRPLSPAIFMEKRGGRLYVARPEYRQHHGHVRCSSGKSKRRESIFVIDKKEARSLCV